jgi:hypothetical protein
MSRHLTLPILEETGYVVLDSYQQPIHPAEWKDLEYVDWKSSGDTRFAPLASAYGQIECNGFWHFDPPKADRDGVWIDSQTAIAPTLTRRVQEIGTNVGRCRIIELKPNSYADGLYNSHLDDNNRLNPEGEGWVLRLFMQLTHNPDSVMILREDINDPSTETRIALPAGAQLLVDSERLWHSVWHQDPAGEPRYCLITSVESGPALEKWVFENSTRTKVDSAYLDQGEAFRGETVAQERRAARAAYYGYDPTSVMSEA